MFISQRILHPHPGKSEMAIERVHRMAGILSRHGARTRIGRVTAGAGAGEIHLYAGFSTMAVGTAAAANMAKDAAYLELMADRESNPAGDVEGPNVARIVMGEPHASDRVRMQRTYSLSRDKLKPALELLVDFVDTIKDHPVNLMAAVPVLSDNMSALTVVYGFPDLRVFGEMVDTIGTSEAFQEMLVKASDLGTLRKARVITAID